MEASKSKTILALIEKASLAPSSHNTQPWRFRVTGTTIDLFADRTRSLPVNDPDDRELAISCGCALMNLRVAAAHERLRVQVDLLPDAGDPDWLARVVVAQKPGALFPETALAECIERRRTYRKPPFSTREVEAATLDQLANAAVTEGAWLRPLVNKDARREAAALVAEGDAAQWANASWRRELAAWLRPRGHGDGLTVRRGVTPFTHMMVRNFDMGSRQGAKDRRLAETAPVLAVLGTEGDQPRDWIKAGQALQRVLLTACRKGMLASYLNQPIQVASLRPKIQSLAGGGHPQILFCLGYPRRPVQRSPRRAAQDVVQWASEAGPAH